ncbi:hypothetical protein CMK18_21695 [Candidatus Poribacteria bacterium]|nr:hypothetical protein [Candidatus Poribacteria bacterium]
MVRRKSGLTKLLKRFDKLMKSGLLTKVASKVNKGMRKTYKGKKAPKGYHFMPGGKLMKDSAHKRKKRGKKKRSKAKKSRR